MVFSLLEPAYDPDEEVSDLWLVAVDGSAAPRRLTQTKAPEKAVVWSPDSHAGSGRSLRSIKLDPLKTPGDEINQAGR